MDEIGPTGKFPQGKSRPDDKGGIAVGVVHVGGRIEIHFGTQLAWIGMNPAEARAFAEAITKHAAIAEAERS